jgi:hypothetical protein
MDRHRDKNKQAVQTPETLKKTEYKKKVCHAWKNFKTKANGFKNTCKGFLTCIQHLWMQMDVQHRYLQPISTVERHIFSLVNRYLYFFNAEQRNRL